MKRKTLFGYVGGKSLLKPRVLEALAMFQKNPYREPFFGGGAIGLHMMEYYQNDIWVNDKDNTVHCVWESVRRFPAELKALVRAFTPSRDQFFRLKSYLLSDPVPSSDDDVVRIGFSKLALQKTSFGALGVMAASPRDPEGTGHWSPANICHVIDDLHPHFQRAKLTQGDYSDVITDESGPALLYLDPPYFAQGPQCYRHSFRYEDHVRLCELLKRTSHDWVLSYDDHPSIRELYEGWSKIETIPAKYSIRGHRTTNELLISSR